MLMKSRNTVSTTVYVWKYKIYILKMTKLIVKEYGIRKLN